MPSDRPQELELPASGIMAVESRHNEAFRMEPQRHAFHEVFLLLRGGITVLLHPEAPPAAPLERHMHPGDYLIVPAGVAHAIRDRRASTLVLVAFSPEVPAAVPGRRAVWEELQRPHPVPFPVYSAAPIHLQDNAWRDLIAMDDLTADRLALETAFSRFLLQLRRLSRRPRDPDARERISVLTRRLPGVAHEEWSLDRAASEVHLSRRRFSDLWRETTGESFTVSVQLARVAAAQRLMRDGDHSIVGAAFAAGFNDLANFYRVFRRCVGMTPGEWLAADTTAEDRSGTIK
jgi:AraC-like DNA-binding protein/uncharacterized protein YjlB